MSKGKKALVALIGLIAGILNGLFGSGGGTILVPALTDIIDLSQDKAQATAISVILPLTIVSSFIYAKSGFADWRLIGLTSVGGIIGGIIGAKFLNKCPTKLLRIIFGFFMIIASIRLLIP